MEIKNSTFGILSNIVRQVEIKESNYENKRLTLFVIQCIKIRRIWCSGELRLGLLIEDSWNVISLIK